MSKFKKEAIGEFKISIIIPVYNREATIVDCLDSIANQTLDPNLFEVIVIDDCSTDDSVEIIRNYTKIPNLRLIVLSDNSGGASKPRNIGIDEALGEYLIFIDSDDCITQNALKLALNLAIQEDLDMVIIPILFGNDRNAYTRLFEDYPEGIKKVFLSQNEKVGQLVFSNPGIIGRLYRTVLLQTSGVRFSEKLRIYEDTLFSRFIFSISDSFGMLPIGSAKYLPSPAVNESNLSLLKRTVERCTTYLIEAIRMCEEVSDSVINNEKKIRILNNSFCRDNIFKILNCPEGYLALSAHIDNLLPYLNSTGIRAKAKKLIQKVYQESFIRKNVILANEYFNSDTVCLLSPCFIKAWCWKNEIFVLDFKIKGYRFGIDVGTVVNGMRSVSLVLRGESNFLKIDWQFYGVRENNHIPLFSHIESENIEVTFSKIAVIVNSLILKLTDLEEV